MTAMLAMIFVYVVVLFVVDGRRQAERQGSIDVVHAAMRVAFRHAVSRAVQAEEQHGNQDNLADESMHGGASLS